MKRIVPFATILIIIILYSISTKSNLVNVLKFDDFELLNMGDEIVIYDEIDCDELLNDLMLEVYSNEVISDRIIIEGYSHKIKNYIVIDNRKVNVQISISDDSIIIGSPLISNSF